MAASPVMVFALRKAMEKFRGKAAAKPEDDDPMEAIADELFSAKSARERAEALRAAIEIATKSKDK